MAPRQMKMPAKDDAEKSPEANDAFSQRKRPELGRYLLQVDRQTKGSYATSNAAQAAALAIKTSHPVLQVSVYDAVDHTYTIVECRPRRRYDVRPRAGPPASLVRRHGFPPVSRLMAQS
jgi:hypothetical protein